MRTVARKPLCLLLPLLALLIGCSSGGKSSSATAVPPTTAPAATPTPEAFDGGPSTQLQLTGLLAKTGVFKLADLKVLPKSDVTTDAAAGNGRLGEHNYGGPLLYDMLMAAQPKMDPNLKNDLLRRAVIVTGSDGYKIAISWGEIDPNFAAKKILVAYERDGQPLPEADGFARLIVPGDGAAGRYISNVVKIEVKDSLPAQTQGVAKPTTSFNMAGAVAKPGAVDLTKLNSLKQTSVSITANGTTTVFGGVLLSDLLQDAGIKIDVNKKNDMLTKGIVGVGSDGYASLIVGGEIDAKFGNLQMLIATSKDGQPLADSDGFARIVVPGDGRAGRYVSNLMRIEVVEL